MTSSFRFSSRSLGNLANVHPDLQKLAHRALQISTIDFVVTEGARTVERQQQLFNGGFSTTMNSRHIPSINGYAHALDVAAILDGEVRWDWTPYETIALAFKQASKELEIPIEWGGDWTSFKDGPHFQLPWAAYPGDKA